MARGDFNRPSANAAAACTAGPESRSAAAGPPSASATSDSAIALQAHGIGNRLEQIEDMLRHTREGMLVSEGDQRGLARGEQVVRPRPLDRVAEGDAPGRELAHPAADPHQVVVAGGGAVADVDLGDGKVDALLLELLVSEPRLAHQLGAGAVEPDEVVGVVDHAHLVGLGIIDAQSYRADHAGAT